MSKSFSPWSLSKANVAKSCTLRFHHQYRLKTPQARIKNNAGRIGSAVHEYLDSILKGRSPGDSFVRAAREGRLTRSEQHILLEFRQPTQRFVDRLNDFVAKQEAKGFDVTVESEERYAFERTGEKVEDWFSRASFWRGIVDVQVVMMKDGKRRLLIIDHKTGKRAHEKSASYQDQVKSYAVAAALMYPDLAGVQTAIHWVREDHDEDIFDWGPYLTKQRIMDDLLPWFYKFYDHAQARTEASPAPTLGDHCTWCPYQHLCPAQRG